MKQTILLFALIFAVLPSFADGYVVVFFQSKEGTPYSIDSAQDFLTQRSLDRRARLNIAVDSLDLPVNPALLDSLVENNIAERILYTSRWFNFAVIVPHENWRNSIAKSWIKDFFEGQHSLIEQNSESDSEESESKSWSNTYYTKNCLEILGIDLLHDSGLTGKNVRVAVLDAGFKSMPKMAVFDSLFNENRVIATRDFVDFDETVYNDHVHGSAVTALMAGNLPGKYKGTAPGAEYILIRCENAATETRLEEYNWVVGAEFADSLGADIINSSLGYNLFDNPAENYSNSDLTGNVAIISRAGGIATDKGIVVVSSAGNDGNASWRYVSVPSDNEKVFTVGAVDSLGKIASFSSVGMPFHHYKPNIVAQGVDVWVPSTTSDLFYKGNGTSYSSPIIAGGVACLLQYFSDKTPSQIMDALQSTAQNAQQPDNILGYGIPNFASAFYTLSNREFPNIGSDIIVEQLMYHRAQSVVSFDIISGAKGEVTIEVFDSLGKKLQNVNHTIYNQMPTPISIPIPSITVPQIIFVVVQNGNRDAVTKKLMIY
ncbi:MAG: S8 family serine peptidase [Salinivirgaceae bacterium]|nr:S8 family serine peptidase [Salinivirgaceae bacterium]